MKPLILLDLDRTLFDSSLFQSELTRTLPAYSNKTQQEVHAKFEYVTQGSGQLLHNPSFFEVLDYCNVSLERFKEIVFDEFSPNMFLIPDAKVLVDWLQAHQYDIEIVTFGDEAIQSIKMSITPYLRHIKYTPITILKRDYIEKAIKTRVGCLIDDKPDQQLPKGWTEIHIDRKAPRAFEPRKISEHVWQISTLDDAPQIIESLHIAIK